MKEEYFIIDTNILIRKANKNWHKILAWIVTMPVKISLVIGFIYFGIALLFGLIAIVVFIGCLFTGESDRALTILTFYTPFLLLVLLSFIYNRIVEKVLTTIMFIVCNLIFYIIPLTYGAYYLRYNYLEEKLQTAEYDRCYDNYCNEKTEAYMNRRALFAVTTENRIITNEHVGHSWIFSNYFNGVSVKNEPLYIWIAEEDTIETASYAFERDVYMDCGRNITRYKVPWNELVDHRVNLLHNVFVMENRGRFTGDICVIECKYSLCRVSEFNIDLSKKSKDYRIPEDSIMKYLFDFHKIYKKQYSRDEYPWKKYMSEEDREDHERNLQELFEGRLKDDGGSRYRIND